MPYIKKEERPQFDGLLNATASKLETPGQLNYCITKLIQQYAKEHGNNYAAYNEVIGVLEAAKMEFYRKVVAPYEDVKEKENGSIKIQGEQNG